ncbi:hypothetical protein BESB_044210 [Besnoitia besnoiti]|uniref:Transmembrane protein n=1 Tax=Besnoitia besnoiti TaxID=94643 RepID=A0A2A9MEC5_BESBE|nr:hypothetical protein BESB_044210 [Besnoitia besnoiti]PFH36229.1 hypothetical protein BESB_044210 [Besnoitia besnoiti]
METQHSTARGKGEPVSLQATPDSASSSMTPNADQLTMRSKSWVHSLAKVSLLAVTFLSGWVCSRVPFDFLGFSQPHRTPAPGQDGVLRPLRAADLPIETFLEGVTLERELPYAPADFSSFSFDGEGAADIVQTPLVAPRRLSENTPPEPPPLPEKPEDASHGKNGEAARRATSLAANFKDEVLPPRKKDVVKLRVLNPHMFRAELCPFLRIGDGQVKSWYALLVLYIAEWPAYAQTGNGGERFTDQLRAFSENFAPPENTTIQGRAIFQAEIDCGTPKVFKEGLDAIKGDIHNFEDLVRILKTIAKAEPDFANLLDYTQYSKLPTRAAVTGFALILRTAFEGMVFSFCRPLFLKNGNKGNFSRNELYSNVVWLFHRNQQQYWMLLLVAKILKQVVSARPHSGILILKSVAPINIGGKGGSGDGEKGQTVETIYGVGSNNTLQDIVAGNIKQKLEKSMSRFQNLSTERGMLSSAKGVLQPQVFVTGYYAKNARGAHVEEGLFGMEVESDTLTELKEDLRPSSVLLQISLVDEWNFKDPRDWPDPRKSEIDVLTAHTAVQMLRAELEWDPSLGTLGAFSVAYTGFTDMYTRQRPDPENHFDQDVHLLIVDELARFGRTGAEEGCKNKISNLIAEEPLHIKRVFDRDRISVKGTAKILPGSDIFMRGNFGLGLSLELQREAEKLLSPGAIMIHVYIKGLGRMTSETNDLDLTASEMVNRLLLRSRGYYEIPVVKTVTPTSNQTVEARSIVNCSNKVPDWVVVVSSCSIVVFFVVIVALLMYHDKMKLPWWLNCICSSSSPWGGDQGDLSRDPTAVEIPAEYDKASIPELTGLEGVGDGISGYDAVEGRGWLPATAKWVGDKSLSVHHSSIKSESQRRLSGYTSSAPSVSCGHPEKLRHVDERHFSRTDNAAPVQSVPSVFSRKTSPGDEKL